MITAMLNFYDETQETLRRVVSDIGQIGASRLVAVDGAYFNFPGGWPRSHSSQISALVSEAQAWGLELLLYQPAVTWKGDEVAKRQFMLDLALTITPADQWLMVYDADYKLECRGGVGVLLHTDLDAADILFTGAPKEDAGWHPMRMFMRAIPGMRMGPNHYTYVLPDGRYSEVLVRESTVKAADLSSMRVRHLHELRPAARHDAQAAYYDKRDTQRLERSGQ